MDRSFNKALWSLIVGLAKDANEEDVVDEALRDLIRTGRVVAQKDSSGQVVYKLNDN